MLRALQDAGKAGKVKFVGFDSSEKLVEAGALPDSSGVLYGGIIAEPFLRDLPAQGDAHDRRVDLIEAIVIRGAPIGGKCIKCGKPLK
jgi:hypothetical protein